MDFPPLLRNHRSTSVRRLFSVVLTFLCWFGVVLMFVIVALFLLRFVVCVFDVFLMSYFRLYVFLTSVWCRFEVCLCV